MSRAGSDRYDRRGTPCGCPAGLHRSPAESPLQAPFPVGARKDAAPTPVRVDARKDAGARLEGRHSWRPLSSVGWVCLKLGGWTSWVFSSELPHRPRSGEILREKEWGFSYPHSHGGTKSPPSYSPNSGPAGDQRRQPWRRGGQECPPSGGACFSQTRGGRSFRSFSGGGRGEEEHGRGRDDAAARFFLNARS